MMSRRWLVRAGLALTAYVALEVLLAVGGLHPDALRLALLVAACGALLSLVSDALGGTAAPWPLEADLQPVPAPGDPRLARDVGVVESHLAARGTDRALRERLGVLADQALRQRHGLGRHDPGAADLLDPYLTQVLDGPPRHLGVADVERCLIAIEEL